MVYPLKGGFACMLARHETVSVLEELYYDSVGRPLSRCVVGVVTRNSAQFYLTFRLGNFSNLRSLSVLFVVCIPFLPLSR